MITSFRQFRDCTSGAALMEAAIVFPLVLTLMLGVIEFGRAFQEYHTADNSMRSAARYLARVPADATCSWGWDNAQNLARHGTIDPPVNPRLLIRDEADLVLERNPSCADDPEEMMVVTISAVIPIPAPFLSALGMSTTLNVSVRHEERHIGG